MSSRRDSTGIKPVSRRPPDTDFRQQRLKAHHPILTPKPVILTFLIVGIVFIPIGAALVAASQSVKEKIQRYDNMCDLGKTCNIKVKVDRMEKPVYMYYVLDNFYQNHRRYVVSRSDTQLKGGVITKYGDVEDCASTDVTALYDENLPDDQKMDPKNWYAPCGLIARSMFNDTFLVKMGNVSVPLNKQGIAWSSDLRQHNNPPPGAPGIRTIPDFKDEDFVVWMSVAGLPNFKKLYRIIDTTLEGELIVTIQNNYNVTKFGKKYFMFSTMSWAGGRNSFLGWAYIVFGTVSLLQGIVFTIKQFVSPRELGDMKYLEWNRT
jgi:hypothetical protein